MVFLLGWERGQHLWVSEFVDSRVQLVGRKIFAFCIVHVLWEHLELDSVVATAGLGFPQMLALSCPVLGHPSGTTGTLSGFGLSSALWGLLQWWQPLFGEVEDTMPCWWLYRTTLVVPGAATSLLVPRGKATSTLPQPCLGSVGAALGDTVTSHRSTCT